MTLVATAPVAVPAATAGDGPAEPDPGSAAVRAGSTTDLATHDGRAFALMMAGYPLAWALGLAPVFYILATVPMALWLIRNRPLRLPSGTVFFLLFLLTVGASSVQLDSIGRIAVYLLRTSWYISAFISFLYLARHRGPQVQATIVRGMVVLWVLIVAGGYLSILFPEMQWSTPAIKLLPDLMAENPFIQELTTPRTSEIQVFRFQDVTLYRPAAPFPYTNAWGSSLALTTPFVLAAIHDRRIGIPRGVLIPLLVAGIVPFYVALNRGSWLTLGLGIGYGLVRYAYVKRNPLPVAVLLAILVAGTGVAVSSGVLNTATEQLATRSAASNETRASLYAQTIKETAKSPLIGYGSTRPNPANPEGPPLGTHGQLWAVLFAHGYLGAGLYLLFFLSAFIRSSPLDPVPHWARVSLLIGILQMPIYGHLPNQLFIMISAAVICNWGRRSHRPRQR